MTQSATVDSELSVQDIVDALVREIEAGRYPIGSLLPSEAHLQAQFGVTRYRLRAAMESLRKLGVIDSRAGIGTRVQAGSPSPFFVHSQQTLESVLESARSTRLRLLQASVVEADASLAERLHAAPGSRWFLMNTLRYLPGVSRPIGSLKLYTRPEFAGAADRLSTWRGPVFQLLERMYGVKVAVVEQEIDAASLEPALADDLGASPGSPCLEVTRHWFDAAGKLLECSLGVYPQGRSRYRSRLRLGS